MLTAIEEVFDDAGVELPDRRYVCDGDVAFDCEQGVVQITRVFSGTPGAEELSPLQCGLPQAAELDIWLIRCVPTIDDHGNPPTQEQIAASSEIIMADGELLRFGLMLKRKAGELLDPHVPVAWGEMRGVGPQGGFAGWLQRLVIEV